MECQGFTLPLCFIPSHQLPVVDAAARLHFRQPTDDAFSWVWILRLLVHNPYDWKSAHWPSFLRNPFESYRDWKLDLGGIPPD